VQGEVFGYKEIEVTGEWRKLGNLELHDCTSEQKLLGCQNLSGQNMWHVRGGLLNMYRVLVQKETHGRPSGRWETVLKLILKNIISGYVFWICVAQDRVK